MERNEFEARLEQFQTQEYELFEKVSVANREKNKYEKDLKEIRDATEGELNQLKSRIDFLLNEKDGMKRDIAE
jgi:chromosome segregation ATPase